MFLQTEDIRQKKTDTDKKDKKTSFLLLCLCLSSFVLYLMSYKL
jgi:hypothetical protein